MTFYHQLFGYFTYATPDEKFTCYTHVRMYWKNLTIESKFERQSNLLFNILFEDVWDPVWKLSSHVQIDVNYPIIRNIVTNIHSRPIRIYDKFMLNYVIYCINI